LQITINYVEDLSNEPTKSLTLDPLTFTLNGSSVTIPGQTVSVSLISSNNQNLEYYDDNTY
jgi:hypothetical protein